MGNTYRPPKWIKPQLTRLVEEAPARVGWLHEIKYDEYRLHYAGRAGTGIADKELKRLVGGLNPLAVASPASGQAGAPSRAASAASASEGVKGTP